MKHLVSLCALALLLSGCVSMSVPNTKAVIVAGPLAGGGIWKETQTGATGDLTLNEMIDLLEPQEERTCVPVEGFNVCKEDQSQGVPVVLPKRGGAIIQPASDWVENHTALEIACRMLGRKCSYEVMQSIKRMKRNVIQ